MANEYPSYQLPIHCVETNKDYIVKTIGMRFGTATARSNEVQFKSYSDLTVDDTYNFYKVLEFIDIPPYQTYTYQFKNGYYFTVRCTDSVGKSKLFEMSQLTDSNGKTYSFPSNFAGTFSVASDGSVKRYFFFSANLADTAIYPYTNIVEPLHLPDGYNGASYLESTGNVSEVYTNTIYSRDTFDTTSCESYKFMSTAINGESGDTPIYWGDTSNKKGGGGSYEYITDNIDFSELPSLSALTSGFTTLYQLPQSQIGNLAGFLWSNTFIDSLKKYFGSPNEAIINFGITKVPIVGTVQSRLFIGNVEVPNIMANRIVSEYVTMDFGSINIPEFWGNYLDYESTSVSIFLPYIGERNLDTKDIVDSTVSLKYYVDLFTGDCVAQLKITKSYGLNSKLYSFDGNVFVKIPTSSSDMAQYYISSVGKIGGAVLAGSVSGGVGAVVALGATSALGMAKSNISRTGNVDGVKGLLNSQRPYLIIARPDQSLASDYNKLHGYPSNISMSLADCTGYTVVEQIHLENIPATSAELDELDALLKAGVIF